MTIHAPEPASNFSWDDGNYVNEVQEAREKEAQEFEP